MKRSERDLRVARAAPAAQTRQGMTMIADEIRDRLTEISKSLEELESRLHPVLTPVESTDQAEPARETSEQSASFREVLETDEFTARLLVERIRRLTGRVDL